jgi:V/A-type H+-transporting ATPase subunit E
MEELVSTGALEREILEDARKKAIRLLRSADEEVSKIAGAITGRKADATADIEKRSAAKAARYREESLKRLPLELARLKTAYVDATLREAVEAFMADLPESRIEAMAASRLRAAAAFLDGRDLRVRRRGLGAQAAERAVAVALPAARIVESVEDAALSAAGLLAEAADGSASMRATVDQAAGALLDGRRGELARVLCAEALAL